MRLFAVMALSLFLFTANAYAAPPVCDAGAEGTIIYNKDHKIVQFCNGTQWIGMVARIGDTGDTLADLSCGNGEIAKWNGTIWACAADDAGTSGLPALASAKIWVGNGSNAATAVSMSGDATLSNAGVLTIGSNAIGSAEIADGSISNADLAGSIALSKLAITGTPDGTKFLKDDGSWGAASAGGGTAGGSTGSVQYRNSSGVFAGDSSFTYDGAGAVTITSPAMVGLTVSGGTAAAAAFSTATTSGYAVSGIASATSAGLSIGGAFQSNNQGGTALQAVAGSNATKGLVVKAWSGQTANLTEWQNSFGNVISSVSSGGIFTGNGSGLTSLNATNLGSGTVPAARMPALTGDVTTTAGATVTSIAANAVGSAEIADGAVTAAKTSVIGTLTEGKWCTVSSGKIVCTSDAPSGGGGGGVATYLGVTASLDRNSDSEAQVEAACVAAFGAGARVAFINDLMPYIHITTIAVSGRVKASSISSMLTGDNNDPDDFQRFYSLIADGLLYGQLNDPNGHATCFGSGSNGSTGWSKSGPLISNSKQLSGSECTISSAWHCVRD